MTIKQKNIVFLALEHGRKMNNFLDCDVVQEALTELEKATTDNARTSALDYLAYCIEYRAGGKDLQARQLLAEYRATVTPPLPCADCAGIGEHVNPSCTN